MICPKCGNRPSYSVAKKYQYRESGLDNVFVNDVGIFRCRCGEEYIQIPGIQEVHDQIALKLLKKNSLLTGQECTFLRKWLRLTSVQIADLLGVTRMSVSRWENNVPTPAMDKLIRLLAADVRNVSLDARALFESIALKPAKGFTIPIDARRLAAPSYTTPLFSGKATSNIELPTKTKRLPVTVFQQSLHAATVARPKTEALALVA